MNQAELNFDIDQAMTARDEGMKQVEQNNARFMFVARETAKRIARRRGTVTADDVRAECPFEPRHHNAWGPVFCTKDFEFTGERRRSKLKQGHGNEQRVWRLRVVNC